MQSDKDYYRILGVLDDAEDIVIRAAYRALAQRYHPDRWQGDVGEATRRMAQINEAYAVLSDAVKRAAYDSTRDKNQFRDEPPDAEDANESINKDWELAVKYLPDLKRIEKDLRAISRELAFTFRLILLEGKRFGESGAVAKELEFGYLTKYFGDQAEVQVFAKELILEGRKDAAKELNEAVRVLGRVAPSVLYRIANDFKTSRYRGDFPQMVILPKGQFAMGSPQDKSARSQNDVPQHMVRIDYELAVGKYPVTFDQWDVCVKDGGTKYNPSDNGWGRGNSPVINVSWDDIQLYLKWLSNITGTTYRLLSEAEWEYAVRAGSQTTYSFGDDELELGRHAWFSSNSGNTTHPVGEKLPNAFGLHDMHGNVWERTADCWNENYTGAPIDGGAWTSGSCDKRVLRGGSWIDGPRFTRSASRSRVVTTYRYGYVGFRVARMLA
jgi:formylglycine-generating enzyme required for sulfatase activity